MLFKRKEESPPPLLERETGSRVSYPAGRHRKGSSLSNETLADPDEQSGSREILLAWSWVSVVSNFAPRFKKIRLTLPKYLDKLPPLLGRRDESSLERRQICGSFHEFRRARSSRLWFSSAVSGVRDWQSARWWAFWCKRRFCRPRRFPRRSTRPFPASQSAFP